MKCQIPIQCFGSKITNPISGKTEIVHLSHITYICFGGKMLGRLLNDPVCETTVEGMSMNFCTLSVFYMLYQKLQSIEFEIPQECNNLPIYFGDKIFGCIESHINKIPICFGGKRTGHMTIVPVCGTTVLSVFIFCIYI